MKFLIKMKDYLEPREWILGIALIILAFTLSWAFACAIIWLICTLFGFTFSLKIATAIWLILFLIS